LLRVNWYIFLKKKGKIKIIDNEVLESHKTKFLNEKINNIIASNERAVFVTRKDQDRNFMLAQEQLKNIKVVDPNCVNVLDLIIHDKVD
jgi:ribosomal protein L4